MLYSYQKPLTGTKIGVVFGSFAPLHQGHLDVIMRAKKENDGGCIVIVCGHNGDKGEPLIPFQKRYRYVRELFSDDDLVAVYPINDSDLGIAQYPDGWGKWLENFNLIWNLAVQNPQITNRVWYVGDEDYADGLRVRNEHSILLNRNDNPISGTKVRNNPAKYWDKISSPFRRVFSHNILITGTASEGKSTLVSDLGKYFNAPYSFEYARKYMKESCIEEWELTTRDYLAFLEGQYNLNSHLINSHENHGIFFADTDSMTTRMYAEAYGVDVDLSLPEGDFEKIASVADEYTKRSKWNKIFVILPHGIFVDDHVRYMGHSDINQRNKMFNILIKNIKDSGNWDITSVINGDYYENFKFIVNYIKTEVLYEKN